MRNDPRAAVTSQARASTLHCAEPDLDHAESAHDSAVPAATGKGLVGTSKVARSGCHSATCGCCGSCCSVGGQALRCANIDSLDPPTLTKEEVPRATIIYRGLRLPFRWFRSSSAKAIDRSLRETLGELRQRPSYRGTAFAVGCSA